MTFDARVADRFAGMSPAEQRVVEFFRHHREEVLMASAAAMAAKAKTSDATVVRTAKGLGYSGLDGLRRALAAEMRQSPSPAERLTRTLGEVGGSLAAAFQTTVETHLQCLQRLSTEISAGQFAKAVEAVVVARRVVVFGIGPSSAIANYLVVQLGRFGIDAVSLTNTGLLFADDVRKLRRGDLVITLAYGEVYAELAALLDAAEALRLKTILITDTLHAALIQRVGMTLSVPRGRSDMLSMHTATLGFIEALLVGVATERPDETLANLKQLNAARRKLAGKATPRHTVK
jgi:DNA-binding MurR/RpiR family transcriptional regulator